MMSSHRYRAIIFDLDGTLIDSSPSILHCFDRAISAAGMRPVLPLDSSLIGPPLRQTLMKLAGSDDPALLDRLVDGFKECYDTEGYKATLVYPGVEEMLSGLSSRSIPLAIATNKRRIPTLKILEHLGWERYFCQVGTLDTPAPPHPDKAALIGFLLNEMGVTADEALYVGDKWEDGEAARSNGMPFAAAGWGYGEWELSAKNEAWLLFNSPHEFNAFLMQ